MHKIISGPCSSANFVIILFYLFCFCVKYYNCLPTAFSQSNSNHDRPMDYTDDVANYLMQFGYLPQSNPQAANLRTITQFEDAIKSLQQFGNIPVTGVVDSDTQKLMLAPRCGTSDIQKTSSPLQITTSKRTKRYALVGTKWQHTDLTWCLKEDGEIRNGDPGNIRRILTSAFAAWAKDSKLTFREIRCSSKVDVEIKFASRDHGDSANFDGPGLILAHAFYPGPRLGGDIHFDSDEEWVYSEDLNEGTNFQGVATHEIGHAIGLGHSSNTSAIMYPWYNGYKIGGLLPEDDRLGIQQLYGVRERQWSSYNPNDRHHHAHPPARPPTTRPPYRKPSTTQRPRHHRPNDIPDDRHRYNGIDDIDKCNMTYDAITVFRGELIIFSGKYSFRIRLDSPRETNISPIETNRIWREVGDAEKIDAAYTNINDELIVFIGRKYYVYHGNILFRSYPITHLGLPQSLDKIDAAFIWGHNNKTYFFSGSEYWKFDEVAQKVDLDYPRKMDIWRGIRYNIDAAFQHTDHKTYFFKGTRYWMFDDKKMQVLNENPKPSGPKWMRCNHVWTHKTNSRERLISPKDDWEQLDLDGTLSTAGANNIIYKTANNLVTIACTILISHLIFRFF